jgi:hypothetical protein
VGCLPEVFASINENFVSAAIKGVLVMARGAGLVDLESLRMVVTDRGADILPGAWDYPELVAIVMEEVYVVL